MAPGVREAMPNQDGCGRSHHPFGCRGPARDIEHACDYLDRVNPILDVAALPRPPQQDTARQWITTWRPVRFRHRGAWRIGVVKAQVQLADGTWVLLIEHASDGMHDGWSAMLWARHDPRSIVLLDVDAISDSRE